MYMKSSNYSDELLRILPIETPKINSLMNPQSIIVLSI